MPTRNTLICTVGTSLFEGNLARLCEGVPDLPDNWRAIKEAYERQDWGRLAGEFLNVQPTQRICGAEINTVEEVRKKGWLELENLIFLVSDTKHGINTGTFLKKYFEKRKDISLKGVYFERVDKLQDTSPSDFKTQGLRNLVRKIGESIQRFGGPEYVAIDATGGYKAQIAIAVLVGQALSIPVFYKHERFSEIIDFPPLPVAFDYQLLADNADLLTDFERGETLTGSDMGEIDPKLRVLLTEINVDGESLYELGPIGQIYLTGFRIRFPKPINLSPATSKKEPTFRDDHYPSGFKEFVKRVWRDNDWISTANSLPYDKQRSIKDIGFHVRNEGDSRKLIGTYQDSNNFGARYRLHLTDESDPALAWAADYLNRKYRS